MAVVAVGSEREREMHDDYMLRNVCIRTAPFGAPGVTVPLFSLPRGLKSFVCKRERKRAIYGKDFGKLKADHNPRALSSCCGGRPISQAWIDRSDIVLVFNIWE